MAKQNYDISKQMHEDLIKAYCKTCEHSWTMQDACDKAVKMPAPRFYITPKHAMQMISPMIQGDFSGLDLLSPLKRKMYLELYDIVIRLSEKRENIGRSLWAIMHDAVIQPASQFFIKGHSLYCIRQDIKMGRVDDSGRQRSHMSQGKRKKK